MSKKYKLIFSAILLAFVAIIAGACFVFFGNKVVKDSPSYVKVESFDGEYYAVAQQKSEYGYKFKIEQFVEDNYILVDLVENNSNLINLSKQKLNLNSGNKFRISVCYTIDGRNDGNYSDAVEWTVTTKLAQVDYDAVVLTGWNLSWDMVLHADFYNVFVYDSQMNMQSYSKNSNTIDFSTLEPGRYVVYIVAKSYNENIIDSQIGSGVEIDLN